MVSSKLRGTTTRARRERESSRFPAVCLDGLLLLTCLLGGLRDLALTTNGGLNGFLGRGAKVCGQRVIHNVPIAARFNSR